MLNWTRRLLALGLLASLAACGGSDDDPPPPGTLAAEATARGFTALVAAADKAGLVSALSSGSSNLTVFAPTDAAFTALATRLGFASATAMVTALDGPTLAKILQYHLLPTKKSGTELVAGGATQPTLYAFEGAAATLGITATGSLKLTDEVLTQANFTALDVPASNGVIHVIDKVLVPPGVLNVVQMAQLNPTFSVLVEAVVAAGLAPTLSSNGPFTVFAPNDAAFTAALTELTLTKAQLLARTDPDLPRGQRQPSRRCRGGTAQACQRDDGAGHGLHGGRHAGHHRRPRAHGQSRRHRHRRQQRRHSRHRQGHPAGPLKACRSGRDPFVLKPTESELMKKFLLTAALTAAAFTAQAKDIVDTAVAAGSFKTLAAALQAAGLVETLKGKGPFTVFAPTDEAFAKIPKADLDALLKDKAKLTAVLTYHVVAGKVMAKDVKAGKVKTVQGSELTLGTTGGVTVNAAKVVKADIVADNGVIHVIDAVVLPK
jgi:uncharacterized surface protein with fasciclin (FAS1) repeats